MSDSSAEAAARSPDMLQQLAEHGIAIHPAPTLHPFVATPLELFSTRKVRFTVEIDHQPITRETTLDRLSTMLAEYIVQKKAALLGVDGINGFKCGPTDEERRTFCHSLEEDDEFLTPFRDTHLPPISPTKRPRRPPAA